MNGMKTWRIGVPGGPAYPHDYEILQKAVLQATDIYNNHNKYYAIELHEAPGAAMPYRLFTHYGRTDDLESNPEAGVREGRYFGEISQAQSCYDRIYRQKTSPRKGYQEVHLASSAIGSVAARGTSSGKVDAKTKKRRRKAPPTHNTYQHRPSHLSPAIQELVQYLYDEATEALTTTVQVEITAQGIQTPLGVLTLGQIETGESILEKAWRAFRAAQRSVGKNNNDHELVDLSGQFYTAIPHRLGRSRAQIQAAVLNSVTEFERKRQTLQLMRDMLQVHKRGALFNSEIDQQYRALGCAIEAVHSDSPTYEKICHHLSHADPNFWTSSVRSIYRVRRPDDEKRFDNHIGNKQLLVHGSRIQNWLGILHRGLLMPRVAVRMGVHRTDEGWLGHGIYFGDIPTTALQYATHGHRGTCLIALSQVALGRVKRYNSVTYGLTSPPRGFDSCHGVARYRNGYSEFDDDEYVIYQPSQQRVQYIVEIED